MLKYKTFKGGYRFRNFLGQPREQLKELPIPQRVIIPLKQGFGGEVKPLVSPGDKVYAGQIIGRDDENVSSPVHSSVNGEVLKIEKINYFKQEITAIFIEAEPTAEWRPLEGYSADWGKLSPEKIEELIYLSGSASLDKEGIPTRFRSSIISPSEVENLIIHGIGSEIYNLSLRLLLSGKNLFHFIEGIRILKKIFPQAEVHLALNKNFKKLVEEISKITSGFDWLKIYALEPKYPQGYDEMLVPTLLGRPFPYGYSAANIGIVILNTQAVLHVYEAVCEGKPLIERTIALCGEGFRENLHLKVKIGTPLKEIFSPYLRKDKEMRLVLNSLLTGIRLNIFSLPLSRTFSQVIALPENREREFLSFLRLGMRSESYTRTFLSALLRGKKKLNTNIHGEPRPCISCGYCQEVCPVRIIPHLLYRFIERNIIDERLSKYGIFNCLECNLCSFVCPSKLPLAKTIKDGQERLITIGCDRAKCILPYFDLKGLEEYRGIK
ncbi:MAG: 4Fe-4S dicluster domain-containing protein [Candidatus Omnitrophica bacterium]|nr:4Fe-4S dicluster domain-containing protein [Candidatus Omnitrophota bacterium]